MRIAMVQGRADPERDGVADYVRHLTRALRGQVPGGGAVDVVDVPFDGLLGAARRIRSAQPDLVHVQFAPSAFGFSPLPGLLPGLLRGVPLVTTLHEYGWWAWPGWVPERVWRTGERRGWFDRETGRLVPASSAAVTTNAGHAGALAGRLGVDAVRVPLAPNVADGGGCEPRDAVRARLGVPADAQIVAFFGFVHPVKGLRYLVDAVSTLRRAGRPVHLLVIGGFTSLALPEDEAAAFHAELTAHIRDRGVAEHVTITGHLAAAEVSAALHACDLAAFPLTAGATTKSGALLSSFAHRLPTLVTAADPPDPELVDGETVVVAPRVRDADVLADGLRRLLDDGDLRARVARGGAAVGADRTWDRIAAAHRDLYARVLSGGCARAA